MLTLPELTRMLNESGCRFELIAHDFPIRSTVDAASLFPLRQSAPTLILQTERGLIACISGYERGRLDLAELKRTFGYSSLKLAPASLVLAETGYVPGAVAMIGHGLPCIFDNRLLEHSFIYGGSGDELHTLKIAPADVARMNTIIGFLN